MKKILILILSLTIMCTMSACGKSHDEKDNNLQSLDENINLELESDDMKEEDDKQEVLEDDQEEEKVEEENKEENETKKENNSSTIRPGLKAFLDDYEAFYKDYCDFLKKYQANPTDLSLIADYATMISKAEKLDNSYDEWQEADLNAKEIQYCAEVYGRMMGMLAEVAE